MALMNRTKSPSQKIMERVGTVTATRVPDVFEDKCKKANKDMTVYESSMRQRVPRVNEYDNPKKPVFRDEKEIEPGMKDFELQFKPDSMENPSFISVFDKLPRYHADRARKI